MKIIYILFIIPLFCISQTLEIGFVEYNYKIPREKPLYKNAVLYFNNTKSVFIYDKIGQNSNNNSGVKMNDEGLSVSFKSEDEEGYQFYRNHQEKTLIFRSAKGLFNSYLVNDTWIAINWKIKNKFKKIGKYKCQKAVGEFRGRTYIAWFTEEIPLSYGPWKLFGLPGLILEAEDTEKMFKAEFKSIKYPCECHFEFKKPAATEVKTLQEYVEFRDNFNDYVFRKMKARMPRKVANRMRKMPKKDNGRKYRDEKIFEWETEEKKDK